MSGVRVGGVVALVVLDVHEYAMLGCCFKEELMVCEGFDGRFGD